MLEWLVIILLALSLIVIYFSDRKSKLYFFGSLNLLIFLAIFIIFFFVYCVRCGYLNLSQYSFSEISKYIIWVTIVVIIFLLFILITNVFKEGSGLSDIVLLLVTVFIWILMNFWILTWIWKDYVYAWDEWNNVILCWSISLNRIL